MKQSKKFFNNMLMSSSFDPALTPTLPIVEIAGDRRILIEKHKCVTQYNDELVVVQMGYGQLQIRGCFLNLARLGKEQLVINGDICSVSIVRKECMQ